MSPRFGKDFKICVLDVLALNSQKRAFSGQTASRTGHACPLQQRVYYLCRKSSVRAALMAELPFPLPVIRFKTGAN
jgi:hypothetical protein